MKEKTKRQKAIIRRRIFLSVTVAVLVVCIAALCFAVNTIIKNASSGDKNQNGSEITSQYESVKPDETVDTNKTVATATVVNTGDIILHSTVLDGAKTSDGNYDFSAFFKYAETYFKSADLATANLEVTLGGRESGAYSGYPAFNSPDCLLDVVKNSGIGFLTTANNHCYDTGLFGLKRTAAQLKAKNIDFIGTKETDADPVYTVKNVNGIKIGMTAYTFENTSAAGQKSINGNIVKAEAAGLINSFNYDRINEFYTEAQSVVEKMKMTVPTQLFFICTGARSISFQTTHGKNQ